MITIHVGDYENMYLDYKGETTFYYFLPGFSVPEISLFVHTVMFYDLYRPAPAYGHTDFQGHREFLFSQLGKRKVYYYPESAYWCSFDIDMPLFLPAYIHSRWIDIHNLVEEIRSAGFPELSGHVTFTSGMEWGYWLTDYFISRMLWEPDTQVADLLLDFTSIFGVESERVRDLLWELVELQSKILVKENPPAAEALKTKPWHRL